MRSGPADNPDVPPSGEDPAPAERAEADLGVPAEDQGPPPSPRRRRIVNAVLCAACALVLAMYLAAASAPPDPEGAFVFDEDIAADAGVTGRWVMIGLSGALTLVFGWRALRAR